MVKWWDPLTVSFMDLEDEESRELGPGPLEFTIISLGGKTRRKGGIGIC